MPDSVASSPSPRSSTAPHRVHPIGADYLGGGLTAFRVWAPAARRVELVVEGGPTIGLNAEDAGYFSGTAQAGPGARYRFRLDQAERLYPDPASRFQPDGPHEASEVIDPSTFMWSDQEWRGLPLEGQVMYEMHIGTFTQEGTWTAAMRQLPELARIGVTTIELMPVAEFEGRRGWGYDGVDLFAPTHLYGRPDDFRGFVDHAHASGLAVILDVVYNHFGPVGNYLRAFSPSYFTAEHENEWGDAINFDGDDSGPVRELLITNAGYLIEEFHLDGLRLDATQQIYDASPEHLLTAIGRRVREKAGHRAVVLVAENERQDTTLIKPVDAGGYGLDAVWNDDFHHSAVVALTGRAEAYYSDMHGTPQELISAAKYGYLFQGQRYAWQRQPRGAPAWGLRPAQFVAFLENHDQVANSARGARLHQLTSPGRWRAMTALLLLAPSTPLLFQGQEFSSSAPFLYFVDFDDELTQAVRKGRAEFLQQFPSVADYEEHAELADPGSVQTFERCKLDFSERQQHAAAYALHQDLLQLRREHSAFRLQRAGGVDGSVLAASALALRFFAEDHVDDRVLIVNLGGDLHRPSFAEPLLAPPPGRDWEVCWSSERAAYGGGGSPALWPDGDWHIPGECAVVLCGTEQRARLEGGVRRRTA
ncbi:MAG TPA: malto-oligosyltrehalose trehalohydrolase [Vicinamibacterales bacterium]|nr:malto-oligosyltrehalose trehalohydrolase [Vicinamibacterales bacterium]